MRRLVLVVSLLVTGLAAPALGQSEAPEGDGGLHVCCGGMVGSVGGSGSISGTVRGPGAGSGRSAPAPAVTTDTAPSAVTEGVVQPAKMKPAAETTDDAPASSRSSAPNGPLLAALIVAVAAAVLFLRRRPAEIG